MCSLLFPSSSSGYEREKRDICQDHKRASSTVLGQTPFCMLPERTEVELTSFSKNRRNTSRLLLFPFWGGDRSWHCGTSARKNGDALPLRKLVNFWVALVVKFDRIWSALPKIYRLVESLLEVFCWENGCVKQLSVPRALKQRFAFYYMYYSSERKLSDTTKLMQWEVWRYNGFLSN